MTGTRPTLPAGRRGAFTLLELLIVIAVIAILAAVAMPVLHIVHIKAKRTEAKHEALNLANAIRAYDAEYSEYPIPEGEAGSDYYETRTGLELMAVLTGEDEVMNPRRLQFYQGKNARGDVAGLIEEPAGSGKFRLVDWWGNEYFVRMDGDYRNGVGKIADCKATVRQGVAVWSKGNPKSDGTFEPCVKWPKSW